MIKYEGRKCEWCSEIFNPRNRIQRFCVIGCRDKFHKAANRKEPTIKRCIYCDELFEKRAAKNDTCIKCKLKVTNSHAMNKEVTLSIRDNTDAENDMIKDFIKKRK